MRPLWEPVQLYPPHSLPALPPQLSLPTLRGSSCFSIAVPAAPQRSTVMKDFFNYLCTVDSVAKTTFPIIQSSHMAGTGKQCKYLSTSFSIYFPNSCRIQIQFLRLPASANTLQENAPARVRTGKLFMP